MIMANVFIRIGDGGTDVPDEVVVAINSFMCAKFKKATVTMVVNGVEYYIDYRETEVKANELS